MLCGKCLLVSATLAVLLSIFVAIEPAPDGPDKWSLKLFFSGIRTVRFLTSSVAYFMGERWEINFLRSITRASLPVDPELKVEKTMFDSVPVIVFRPLTQKADRPALINFHGGGFVFGGAGMTYTLLKRLSLDLDAVVVSVEYRLAPEHIFPAAFDDCVTASLYLLEHAQDYGVDIKRVALIGDSAGGNLAAAVSQRIRSKLKLVILLYPLVQMVNMKLPSYLFGSRRIQGREDVSLFALYYSLGNAMYVEQVKRNEHVSPEMKEFLYTKYVNSEDLPQELIHRGYEHEKTNFGNASIWAEIKGTFMNPYFAPLLADDLSGLPETYILTCGFDMLRDDGFLYARKLKMAGNEVTHVHAPTTVHGFIQFTFLKEWQKQYDRLNDFLKLKL